MLGTYVDGSPRSLREVASFLDTSVAGGAGAYSESLRTALGRLREVWTGESGEALNQSLHKGRTSLIAIEEQAKARASDVRRLADELDAVLAALMDIRATARSGGLAVMMTTIYRPVLDPRAMLGSAEYQRYLRQVDLWRWIKSTVGEAKARWDRAVESFSDSWESSSSSLVGTTVELFSTAVTGSALAHKGYQLAAHRNLMSSLLESTRSHISASVDAEGKLRVPRSRYYELVDQAEHLKVSAATADDTLKNGLRVGSKLSKGLLGLGIAGTGYAIYDDIQSGESVEQAVASNVGGFAAGMLAGAGAGAVVGTIIGGPVGTVVGAVVGGLVGAGVGMFTSGVIDHLFENASATIASTLQAGFDEVANTVGAVGDAIGGLWSSLFG